MVALVIARAAPETRRLLSRAAGGVMHFARREGVSQSAARCPRSGLGRPRLLGEWFRPLPAFANGVAGFAARALLRLRRSSVSELLLAHGPL